MPTVYALVADSKLPFRDDNDDPASGYKLFVYVAGGTTKATSYLDSDGAVANSNPIVMNSRGEMPSGCYVESGPHKLVFAPASDTDPPASAIWTRDNLTPINDTATTASEWISSGLTPSFIDATSFSFSGDQTSVFHVGRRLKIQDSGGTDYATITASAFTSLTTITVDVDASGSLDSGIADVSYALLSSNNPSSPGSPCRFWVHFNGTGTPAIVDSYNEDGLADNGTGDYTVTVDADFSSAGWSPLVASGTFQTNVSDIAAGSLRVTTSNSSGTATDVGLCSACGFGDLA